MVENVLGPIGAIVYLTAPTIAFALVVRGHRALAATLATIWFGVTIAAAISPVGPWLLIVVPFVLLLNFFGVFAATLCTGYKRGRAAC